VTTNVPRFCVNYADDRQNSFKPLIESSSELNYLLLLFYESQVVALQISESDAFKFL
jgi:hypothetical protein